MEECQAYTGELARALRQCRREFEAMGSASRQDIFLALLESESLCMRVGELQARTHLSRAALSHHLRILREAGLVELRRVGTRNYYFPSASLGEWAKLKHLFDRICQTVEQANANGWGKDWVPEEER